ncbi:MAG: radical SAM protein [Proteobacteria bacterium]|nr:radical SAM protein [Pseudomonadota bacterium]MBU1714214.1 radical SAM protein [Pseudomonadota bacterium]
MTIIELAENKISAKQARPTRLTLPVAPRAFCRIRFDPIDSPARAVPPIGALTWLAENIKQGAQIKAIDLNGPGDPLAEINGTIEILNLIRRKYPELALSITTLGLYSEKHAKSLAKAGVKSVTLLVDAVDLTVAGKLYAWIRPGKNTIPLAQATELLITEQKKAVQAFAQAGCAVTIRSTVYPGFNDHHIENIAELMAGYGAADMIIVPYHPAADEAESLLERPSPETMQQLRKKAAKHLQTRLDEEKENQLGVGCPSLLGACQDIATLQPKPSKTRPNIAVVSSNGMEINLHLGQAYQVLIYGPRGDGLICLLTTRPVPEPGSGSSRWEELSRSLTDCFAVLTASAGESPRRILAEHGIPVLITDHEIEGTVDRLYGGGKKGKCKK